MKRNTKFIWLGVIFIVAAALALIFFLNSQNNDSSSTLSIGNSPVLGNADAPVTIYEFSDFSCPYCQAAAGKNELAINSLKSRMPGWEAPIPKIIEEYVQTGKARIVFKYFPGHGAATAAHTVALGLNEQNSTLFWDFADKAFASSTGLNDLPKMKALAVSLGANETELTNYLNSNKYQSQLDEDKVMGIANGVTGTPSFFINGINVKGAQSFSYFADIIDQELEK